MRLTRFLPPSERSRRQSQRHTLASRSQLSLGFRVLGFELASAMTHVLHGNSHQLKHGFATIRQ
jgi:hypothetical protein